jgi:threonine synthase
VTASVSDKEILEAKALIDRSGIGCEPASAATLAGLRKLVASGTVGKDETAACLLTGSLLKDTDAIEHSLRIASPNRAAEPCPVELSIENIRRVLM